MVDKNKCILAYNLSESEIKHLRILTPKVIEINPNMCQLKISEILNGSSLEQVNENPINEKVILYNDFPEVQLKSVIKNTRSKIKGGILAVVTPVSSNWSMNYLINHLMEERELYSKK